MIRFSTPFNDTPPGGICVEGNRKRMWARRIGRVSVVVIAVLAVVAIAPGVARADRPVSRIAIMAFGSFSGAGDFTSFGVEAACTSFDGCHGVAGFPFPRFELRETIGGSFGCTPSDNPTECQITIASADISCVLTTSASPLPGTQNPVHIDCSAPQGSGDGFTTLNLLL